MARFSYPLPNGAKITVEARSRQEAEQRLSEEVARYEARLDRGSMVDKAGGALDAFTQGITAGWGDELTALESAALGRTPEGGWFDYSRPFDERRQRALDAERNQQSSFRADAPVTATAAEFAGAMVPMARAAQATGRAAQLAQGVRTGAAQGALYGAGESEGGDMMGAPRAAREAAEGGLVGGAVGGALTGLTQAIRPRLMRPAAADSERIAREAGEAFDKLRADNPKFPGFRNFAASLSKELREKGFDADPGSLHPGTRSALRAILRAADADDVVDYRTLEIARARAGDAAGNFSSKADQKFGMLIKERLDEYLTDLAPSATSRGLNAARERYRRVVNSTRVAEALATAEARAAQSGTGGNIQNTMRQEIGKLIRTPKARKSFTKTEIAALQAFANGSKLSDALRWLSRFAPTASTVGGMGNAAMTATNPVVGAALAGATEGAKRLGERMSYNDMLRLQSGMITGQFSPVRAEAMIGQTGMGRIGRAAGAVGGQNNGLMEMLP